MTSSHYLIRSVGIAAKTQGMAHSDLAHKAGMSKEQLSRPLTGTGSARVDTLANLGAVVGLRVALVTDDDLAADLLADNFTKVPT